MANQCFINEITSSHTSLKTSGRATYALCAIGLFTSEGLSCLGIIFFLRIFKRHNINVKRPLGRMESK